MAATRTKWMRSLFGALCLLLAIGVVASANTGLFVRRQLYNTEAFTQHATSLLSNTYVRDGLAQNITDQLIGQIPQFKVAAPLVETAVSAVVGTPEFRDVFGKAAAQLQS
ncbi:MAG: hypothetical protein ACOYN3_08350, partial [Acidimicrobiia bacterium]